MRETERSEFGARLFKARKLANRTQVAVAKKAGMSQPAYQEAETTGGGSSKTVQLAAALGVNADWLATGNGAMFNEAANAEVPLPTLQAGDLDAAFVTIAEAIKPARKLQRLALVPMFTMLAMEPEQVHEVAHQVRVLLLPSPPPPPDSDNGSGPPAPIGGPLPPTSRFPGSPADEKRASLQGKNPSKR